MVGFRSKVHATTGSLIPIFWRQFRAARIQSRLGLSRPRRCGGVVYGHSTLVWVVAYLEVWVWVEGSGGCRDMIGGMTKGKGGMGGGMGLRLGHGPKHG